MVFTELGRLIAMVLGCWCALVFGAIAIQLFRGGILTSGMLRAANGGPVTVGRMQLMLTTIGIAIGYAGAALTRGPGDGLPDVPMGIVIALMGSHGIYLGGKRSLL